MYKHIVLILWKVAFASSKMQKINDPMQCYYGYNPYSSLTYSMNMSLNNLGYI